MKNNNIKVIALALAFLLSYMSCDDKKDLEVSPYASITNLTFASGSYTIQVNFGEIVNVSVTPGNITINVADITIESSDPSVASATVTKSEAGVITVSIVTKKVGTATLKLKIKNSTITGSVNVVVTADAPPPSAPISLGLTGCSVDLFIGQTYNLNTNVSPKNAKDTSVTWSSDNGTFITFTDKTNIKAVSPGVENVIATSNADKNLVEKCKINVLTPATSIELSQTTLTLTYGSTATLTAIVKPNNASIKTVNWNIDNKEIATVINGIITPLKAGKANITVSSTGNPEITATCELTILSKNITAVNITEETHNLIKLESYKLNTEVLPEDADNKLLTWISENKEIVSVSENGTITGHKLGETKVYATSNQNTSAKDSVTVYVHGISISKNTLEMNKGTDYTLTASFYPSTLTNVTWSSSNENIATVNANTGVVTAISRGEVQIYATISNPESGKPPFVDTCRVTVKIYLKSITLNHTRYVLEKENTITLTPTFTPEDADDKTVTWTSKYPLVAKVEEGLVTALSIGETDIKVVSVFDNNINAISKVFVKGITLNKYALNLKKGNTQNLHAVLYPTDLDNMNLNWVSSNDASVTVDNTGRIKAVSAGNATITVTSAGDNTISASCVITVADNPSGIELNFSNLELLRGETETLTGTITRQVTNNSVRWTSDNEKIATVDATSGVVLAKSGGNVNIIGKSVEDPTIFDTCKLFVNAINLDHNSLDIPKYSSAKITPTVFLSSTQNLAVKYETNNANVATVDANGLITGVNIGEAVIKAISVSNSAVFDTCKVMVQGIIFSETAVEVLKDQTKTLTATFSPSTLTGNIIWSIDNTQKAEITSDGGVLNGKNYGEAIVKATSSTNSLIYETLKISVVGITLSPATVTLIVGGNKTLTHTGFSAKTKDLSVTYTSSAPEIVSVSTTGMITGQKVGNADITIKYSNDQALTSTSSINVQGIELDVTKIALKKNASKKVTATVFPSSLVGGVTWSSKDEQIATVNSEGLITAVNYGSTIITATSNDNAELKVSVIVNVLVLTLDKKREFIVKGRSKTLVGTFTPSDFSNTAFTWRSENTSKVTVINGEVTAVDTGTTNVIITSSYDNTITDTCKVSVPYISLNAYSTLLDKYNPDTRSFYLVPSIYPDDLPIKTFKYKSDDVNVATVSSAGHIYLTFTEIDNFNEPDLTYFTSIFIQGGVTTVKVTSDYDENIISTFKVIAQGIRADKNDIVLLKGETEKVTITYYYEDGTSDNTGSKINVTKFKSADVSIASVDASGNITGNELGKTFIHVYAQYYGLANEYYQKINVFLPTISIDKENILLKSLNETAQLNATITPEGVPNSTMIEWSSDNTNVATVNEKGLVTKVGVGTANIIAKYKFSNNQKSISDTCVVTGYHFYFENKRKSIVKSNSQTLSLNVNLGGTFSNEVTFTSSNPAVATVSSTGEVNALEYGKTFIYLSSNSVNDFKDTCLVFVVKTIHFGEFKFEKSNNQGMLNDVYLDNFNILQYGGDFKYIAKVKLTPSFTVPNGATVTVGGQSQISGITEQDFTSPLNYVISLGGNTETYRVALNFINDSFDVSNIGVLISKDRLLAEGGFYHWRIATAIIADSMNGYNVVSIGNNAFNLTINSYLKYLKLPNSLITIESNAFNSCVLTNVKNLIIPNKVTSIGEGAFKYSFISGDLYIPPSVTNIGNNAFKGCNRLNSLRYKDGTTIGTDAFIDVPNVSTY